LNTFTLPRKVFENMAQSENWEITTLSLKPEYGANSLGLFEPACVNVRKPVAVMCNYLSGDKNSERNSNFMLIGIDYDYQEQYGCYRHALYQIIKQARQNNISNIHLGFAASFEKKKLGAKIVPTIAYMQAKDNFNFEIIHSTV
jgi:hypothetical protein